MKCHHGLIINKNQKRQSSVHDRGPLTALVCLELYEVMGRELMLCSWWNDDYVLWGKAHRC